MDEAKAAAYYDELTRKGSGAARFKQGLGFTSSSNDPPKPGEALPTPSSSFYSSFVRASTNPSEPSDHDRRSRLGSVRDKLRKKDCSPSPDRSRRHSERSRRERGREGRRSRSRSRSRSRERERRRRRRSRSRSRSRERDRRGSRGSGRRSRSPRRGREEKRDGGKSGKGSVLDYARLIEGYSEMSPAERVKAKMKLQLKETAKKDVTKGSNSKWERFDFDKDAPLDDEEIDVAEDDASLVKDIGQTFRYTAMQAKREDEIKAAHDQAMFGAPAAPLSQPEEPADDDDKGESNEDLVKSSTLISDNLVSAMQQGSWRDRVRRSKEAL